MCGVEALEVLNLHRPRNATKADGYMPSLQGEISQRKQVFNMEKQLNAARIRLSVTESENKQVCCSTLPGTHSFAHGERPPDSGGFALRGMCRFVSRSTS